jgi:hypothetical protein
MELIGPAPLSVDENPWSGMRAPPTEVPSTYARCGCEPLVGVSIVQVRTYRGARGHSSLILLFHCTNRSDRTGHVEWCTPPKHDDMQAVAFVPEM